MNKNEFGQPIGDTVPNWQPCDVPRHETITGHYTVLEPLSVSHAGGLFEAFSAGGNEGLWTYMFDGPFANEDELGAFLETAETSRDPLFFCIKAKDSGRLLGFASFLRIEPDVGCIEVGSIAFSPLMQRTAFSTDAMFSMMRTVFEQYGYRRYEWKCDALNAKSRAAALRLGFTFEGIFRQAILYKGRNRDTAWFSILDGEWPALKTRFERWLSPDNFSKDGRQIHRLEDL